MKSFTLLFTIIMIFFSNCLTVLTNKMLKIKNNLKIQKEEIKEDSAERNQKLNESTLKKTQKRGGGRRNTCLIF